MSYLHQHRVCHGQLKSMNCVVDDRWVCKITGNTTELWARSRLDRRRWVSYLQVSCCLLIHEDIGFLPPRGDSDSYKNSTLKMKNYANERRDWFTLLFLLKSFGGLIRLRTEDIPSGQQGRTSLHLSPETHGNLPATWVSGLKRGAHTGWRRVQVKNTKMNQI